MGQGPSNPFNVTQDIEGTIPASASTSGRVTPTPNREIPSVDQSSQNDLGQTNEFPESVDKDPVEYKKQQESKTSEEADREDKKKFWLKGAYEKLLRRWRQENQEKFQAKFFCNGETKEVVMKEVVIVIDDEEEESLKQMLCLRHGLDLELENNVKVAEVKAPPIRKKDVSAEEVVPIIRTRAQKAADASKIQVEVQTTNRPKEKAIRKSQKKHTYDQSALATIDQEGVPMVESAEFSAANKPQGTSTEETGGENNNNTRASSPENPMNDGSVNYPNPRVTKRNATGSNVGDEMEVEELEDTGVCPSPPKISRLDLEAENSESESISKIPGVDLGETVVQGDNNREIESGENADGMELDESKGREIRKSASEISPLNLEAESLSTIPRADSSEIVVQNDNYEIESELCPDANGMESEVDSVTTACVSHLVQTLNSESLSKVHEAACVESVAQSDKDDLIKSKEGPDGMMLDEGKCKSVSEIYPLVQALNSESLSKVTEADCVESVAQGDQDKEIESEPGPYKIFVPEPEGEDIVFGFNCEKVIHIESEADDQEVIEIQSDGEEVIEIDIESDEEDVTSIKYVNSYDLEVVLDEKFDEDFEEEIELEIFPDSPSAEEMFSLGFHEARFPSLIHNVRSLAEGPFDDNNNNLVVEDELIELEIYDDQMEEEGPSANANVTETREETLNGTDAGFLSDATAVEILVESDSESEEQSNDIEMNGGDTLAKQTSNIIFRPERHTIAADPLLLPCCSSSIKNPVSAQQLSSRTIQNIVEANNSWRRVGENFIAGLAQPSTYFSRRNNLVSIPWAPMNKRKDPLAIVNFGPLACRECKWFWSFSDISFRNHMLIHHRKGLTDKEISRLKEEQMWYKCRTYECKFITNSSLAQKNHYQICGKKSGRSLKDSFTTGLFCTNANGRLIHSSSAANTADKPQNNKVDLGLLEEDDEFEEFPTDNWESKNGEEEEVKVWEDNWDDDNIEDDFSVQLKAELIKQGFLDDKGNPTSKSS